MISKRDQQESGAVACSWGVNGPVPAPTQGPLNDQREAQTTEAGAELVPAVLHQYNGHQHGKAAGGEGAQRRPHIPRMAAICPARIAAKQQLTHQNRLERVARGSPSRNRQPGRCRGDSIRNQIETAVHEAGCADLVRSAAQPSISNARQAELCSRRAQSETGCESRLIALTADH